MALLLGLAVGCITLYGLVLDLQADPHTRP